ncbi:MAG TPA: AraC family transcriptional regulator [Amycolatopsis sp.]|jgi:AraC-like DNA-binding protein|nr:AraC family transcriptional regulator [Amycolatopsis sp.]
MNPKPEGTLLGHLPNEAVAADFGLFRDVLRAHYYPARVEPVDGKGHMNRPRLSAVELHHLTVGYIRFGTEITIDAGDLRAYHVDVPVRGSVVSGCGDQQTVASPAQGAVFSPRRHTRVSAWGGDADQLLIKLNRSSVERELENLLHRPVTEPLEFAMTMPFTTGAGRAWRSVLEGLLGFVDAAPPAPGHTELLERTLISGLLLAQHHSYSEALITDDRRPARSSLDPVVAAIESAPEHPYTLGDLCRIAALSARGLQLQFRQQLGCTPMEYLRRVRLDRARARLREGRESVSAVAADLGFTNLGRFSRAYEERFGERPSKTARR